MQEEPGTPSARPLPASALGASGDTHLEARSISPISRTGKPSLHQVEPARDVYGTAEQGRALKLGFPPGALLIAPHRRCWCLRTPAGPSAGWQKRRALPRGLRLPRLLQAEKSTGPSLCLRLPLFSALLQKMGKQSIKTCTVNKPN